MGATTTQPSREGKIYGCILIVGAIVQLILLAISILTTPGHFSQLGDIISLIVGFTGILGAYIIIGCFALRARKPETIFVFRLATIIGLVCGSALGILMAMLASKPHEAGLGVFFITVMPLFLLQTLQYTGTSGIGALGGTFLALSLHILAFLGMGIGGFWMAKRTASVKYGIGSTLLLAMITTLFILYGGLVYMLIFPNLYLSLSNYTNAMTLFLAPLIPLLLYALTSGTIGAFLSRLGHSHSMQNG